MAKNKRVNVKAILADADLRRKLMVSTIQATQAREGIDTTEEQADRAYHVVSEGEKAAFFQLEPYRQKQGQPERRKEVFEQSVRAIKDKIRFDVARRDFNTIEGAPLAYSQVPYVAHIFREYPTMSSIAEAWQGVITRDDERYFRFWWEVKPRILHRPWVPLHKGGGFARFYYEADLVIDWSEKAKQEFHRLRDVSIYFRQGLTWPRRTAKGLNVRRLPNACVFSDKGPALLLTNEDEEDFVLGLSNSAAFEYLFKCKTSFSWEIGVMKSMPLPSRSSSIARTVSLLASQIYNHKREWDVGNEVSKRFQVPWLLLFDYAGFDKSISARLAHVAEREAVAEVHIQRLYAELNEEVYKLYGIPDTTRAIIEETLGERPPEVLWPQMERKTVEQKRMEHVWRLLSYAVKRVVEADDDGIVPFAPVSGETSLLDRAHQELAQLFPTQDINQVEVEIANELNRKVKGYKRVSSIGEWLDNIYFDYHSSLYKSRPIIWHIASTQGSSPFAFGALCHYHKLDSNRMAKLRASYLRDASEVFRREAALADQEGRAEDRVEWQAKFEEAQTLDRQLQAIQEGHHAGAEGGDRDYRILTPWKSPEDRPNGWDPDLNDGVKVNIEPLQKAGVLRIAKVV